MDIAQIAVLVNTQERKQLFDYFIPSELIDHIEIGAKVTVPFGSRPVHGYVFSLTSSSEHSKLKGILDLEPEEFWLTPLQLKLADRLSDYYLAPLAQVLETIVPGSFQGKYLLYYYPETNGIDYSALKRENTRQIHEFLINKGKRVSRQEVLKEFGPGAVQSLNELVTMGMVYKEYELSASSAGYKRVKGFQISENRVEADGVPLTNLQQQTLEFLAAQGQPLSYGEIREALSVSRSVLQALIKKGLIEEVLITKARQPLELQASGPQKTITLTPDQARIVQEISGSLGSGKVNRYLIHGITGSGKTEVYKQIVKRSIQKGMSVIILVPEISLTPQLAREFTQAFGKQIAVLHSRLSTGERFDQWNRIRRGEAVVVLGARSAIFAPVKDLGLVIVDEEHESSYKQGEAPYYHAVQVAELLVESCNSTLILGSATPNLSRYYWAKEGRYKLHTLTERVGGGRLPQVVITDMREELKEGNRSIFSRILHLSLSEILDRGEQAILFLNRRGYASFILCRSCGQVIKCPNCQVSLTVHKARPRLSCHYCGTERRIPQSCPVCKSQYIRDFGVGTERVEKEVRKLFPSAKVARLDSDMTGQKGKAARILSDFGNKRIDVLVGTQMVAKGLDVPNVTLVGVIAADLALNLPDYASAERTFQLISQVAGRAGRGKKPGNVVIQTYNPEHYSIRAAAEHDYHCFYQQELKFRGSLNYPPFYDMLLVSVSSSQQRTALAAGEELETALRANLSGNCKISPNHPAPIPKIRNRYRYQVMLRWPARAVTASDKEKVYWICKNHSQTSTNDIRVGIDVDPISVL